LVLLLVANLTSTFTVSTSAFSRYYSYESVDEIQCGATACESFSYGEVEDYTVNIGAAITSITTAKTGIDLGNENQFQMY
jgi:hypothetical protein